MPRCNTNAPVGSVELLCGALLRELPFSFPRWQLTRRAQEQNLSSRAHAVQTVSLQSAWNLHQWQMAPIP